MQTTKSNIIRTVQGDLLQPGSTRSLQGINEQEMEAIRLSLVSAQKEALVFQAIPEDVIPQVIQHSGSLWEELGFEKAKVEEDSPAQIRTFFANRKKVVESLEEKFLPGVSEVSGITPEEYEHLVISIQSGIKEAMVFSQFQDGTELWAMEAMKGMFHSWGAGPWDHYDPYRDNLLEFFEERKEMLYSILEAINQPYPGVTYPVPSI